MAYMCPGANCDTGLMFCQVDCSTYSETTYLDPTTPIAATLYEEPIGSPYLCNNCQNTSPANYPSGENFSYSEELSHSCSGSLTASVGAELGDDSVGKLNLSEATTLSNGWQKQDSYTITRYDGVVVSVPACSAKTITWTRKYLGGNFSKFGYIGWNCKIRDFCYIGDWINGYGECEYTTSDASGDNRDCYEIECSVSDTQCQGGCGD